MRKGSSLKYVFILCLLFLAFIFAACKNKPGDNTAVKNKRSDSLTSIGSGKPIKQDSIIYRSIFKNKYILSEFMTDWGGIDSIIIYEKKDNKLIEIWKYEYILSDSSIDLVTIDNIDYLYYSETESGMHMGQVNLNLVDFRNDKLYTLSYSGDNGDYEEREPIAPELSNKKKLLSYLNKKAAISYEVYKPTVRELDLSRPENYIRNWETKNATLYDKLNKHKNKYYYLVMAPLVKKYARKLFGTEKVKWDIENEKYGVSCLDQRSYVIGYNKITKKYFVVTYGRGINSLKFTSEYEFLMYNGSEKFKVDLKKSRIMSF